MPLALARVRCDTVVDALSQAWDKMDRKLLAELAELATEALLWIESSDSFEDCPNVQLLCVTYVAQQAEKLAGREVWLCTMACNQHLHTAWPTEAALESWMGEIQQQLWSS